MRIGIDVQTLETNERHRGIGKLCHRMVRLLLEQTPHEFILFGREAEPNELIRSLLDSRCSFAAMNTGTVHGAGIPDCTAPFLWSTPAARGLDLYHVTSPLMPDIVLPSVASPCPVVATLLDAIPAVLHARGTPLFDDAGWRRYLERVEVLRGWQGFLPISVSASEDCAAHFALPGNRMHVTWVPIEPRPLAGRSDGELLQLLSRFALSPGYIVSVSGYNPRKNIGGMLASYARLPQEIRKAHPLVLVCALTEAERAEIEASARAYAIQDTFQATGYVSDDELMALVRHAACMLFTSRYEGFGIPPAEAMALGTPVIVSNTSSLPEVAGDAGLLVDPDDEAGTADAILQLLQGEQERRLRIARGLVHVQMFAPDRYVKRVEAAYRAAAAAPELTSPRATSEAGNATALRIAYFPPSSTAGPTQSPAPDWAEDLLASLAEHGVQHDTFVPDPGRDTAAVFHRSTFQKHHDRRPYDLAVYRVGSEPGLPENLFYADAWPGIILTERENLPGPAELVSSVAAKNQLLHCSLSAPLQNDAPGAGRRTLPLGIASGTDSSDPAGQAGLRREHRLDQDAFVIAMCGGIRCKAGAVVLLNAFEKLRRVRPDATLIIPGAADPQLLQFLHDLCGRRQLKNSVRFPGPGARRQLEQILCLADVCVFLDEEDSSPGASLILSALGAGRPLLASAASQLREIPESVCWKLRGGSDLEHDLGTAFQHLAMSPETRATLGRNALAWVAERRWNHLGKQYLAVLREAARARDLASADSPGSNRKA